MNVELIVGIVSAAVSVAGAIFSLVNARRSMYLEVIVKKRQQSVEERRQILKELYYYTDPVLVINKKIDTEEHIKKLTEIRARLNYRLIDTLYPESEIIKCSDDVVGETIDFLCRENRELPSSIKRNNCLQWIKVYNFASWKFVQSQSIGQHKNSISAFNKCYKKSLRQLLKEKEKMNKKWSVKQKIKAYFGRMFMPVNELESSLFLESESKNTSD